MADYVRWEIDGAGTFATHTGEAGVTRERIAPLVVTPIWQQNTIRSLTENEWLASGSPSRWDTDGAGLYAAHWDAVGAAQWLQYAGAGIDALRDLYATRPLADIAVTFAWDLRPGESCEWVCVQTASEFAWDLRDYESCEWDAGVPGTTWRVEAGAQISCTWDCGANGFAWDLRDRESCQWSAGFTGRTTWPVDASGNISCEWMPSNNVAPPDCITDDGVYPGGNRRWNYAF